MNSLVRHLQVTSQTRFDERGNPKPVTQYSYYVLQHGPFSDTYEEGQDSPEKVNLGFTARVDKLRAVGGLPEGS
jgi:hypothetical protein